MKIDRISHIPFYLQIKNDIYNEIINGAVKPDKQILSEPKLAEKYQVNRLTARKAITELVNEGYLYRIHGQGTFVKKTTEDTSSLRVTSFIEDMNKRGIQVESKVLIASKMDPDEKLEDILKLKTGDKVYYIRILRYVNKEPIVLTDVYLPSKLCTGILDQDLEKESLYKILKNQYKLGIINAKETMEALLAKDVFSDLFGIDPGAPVLYSTRLSMLPHNIPIAYSCSWYRGDRYIFEIDLK